jgi:hypothetical protein
MFTGKFGIEIEFSGITRERAAQVAAEVIGGTIQGTNVIAPDERVWKFVSDASIVCRRKIRGQIVVADRDYSVELVSPILTYREDIATLQEVVRRLRKAGGFSGKGSGCGIHIHLDGAPHTPRSVRNFINIIASKNDLFYKALQIEPERMRYCKKMDEYMVGRMNGLRLTSFAQIENIWYAGYDGSRTGHYHQSRYHFLNLHSFFHGHRTIELRGFNSDLHAGRVRSYIVLALALNHQALTQKSASSKKPQVENEKFAMRVYLNRIGFIGPEFKNCREHLCCHLSGNSAWRYRVGA